MIAIVDPSQADAVIVGDGHAPVVAVLLGSARTIGAGGTGLEVWRRGQGLFSHCWLRARPRVALCATSGGASTGPPLLTPV
jgi:hypothetical protein